MLASLDAAHKACWKDQAPFSGFLHANLQPFSVVRSPAGKQRFFPSYSSQNNAHCVQTAACLPFQKLSPTLGMNSAGAVQTLLLKASEQDRPLAGRNFKELLFSQGRCPGMNQPPRLNALLSGVCSCIRACEEKLYSRLMG